MRQFRFLGFGAAVGIVSLIFSSVVLADGRTPSNTESGSEVSSVSTETAPKAKLSPAERYRLVVSGELLGRGLVYSANMDYSVSKELSLGAGISGLSIGDVSIVPLPLYANFYVGNPAGEHRFFLTAGVTPLFASIDGSRTRGSTSEFRLFDYDDEQRASGVAFLGTAGAGYEFRGNNGFVFRALPYLLVSPYTGQAIMTFGLSVGVAM
jgi:hypothetical protein